MNSNLHNAEAEISEDTAIETIQNIRERKKLSSFIERVSSN